MVYAGSSISRGRAKGVVVATGARTAVGQLALDLLGVLEGQPPLLQRMEKFTRVVAYAVLGAATAIGLRGVLLRGYGAGDMFLFGVALAVSAIPEGLPVALTVALAVATTRMSCRRVIVRRLAAVEGLGSCTLIASDKTGTLTCNELTVRALHLPSGQEYAVAGEGYAPEGAVESAAALCNEADLHRRDGDWIWRGDPTDVALLSFAHKLGLVREEVIDRYPQINEIPFEPERRFAATYHRIDDCTGDEPDPSGGDHLGVLGPHAGHAHAHGAKDLGRRTRRLPNPCQLVRTGVEHRRHHGDPQMVVASSPNKPRKLTVAFDARIARLALHKPACSSPSWRWSTRRWVSDKKVTFREENPNNSG